MKRFSSPPLLRQKLEHQLFDALLSGSQFLANGVGGHRLIWFRKLRSDLFRCGWTRTRAKFHNHSGNGFMLVIEHFKGSPACVGDCSNCCLHCGFLCFCSSHHYLENFHCNSFAHTTAEMEDDGTNVQSPKYCESGGIWLGFVHIEAFLLQKFAMLTILAIGGLTPAF